MWDFFFEEILLKIGFTEEMRCTSTLGKKEVPQTFFHHYS